MFKLAVFYVFSEKAIVEEVPAPEEPAAVLDGEDDSDENSSSSSEEGILENKTLKDSKLHEKKEQNYENELFFIVQP